jgi:hypothetical protein
MPKPTNRRTFLKGTAGAVGIGAVGALATKLKLGPASLSANTQATVETIPVFLVPNGGKKQGMSVLVPPASASAGDNVEWLPKTDNIERIVRVQFKDPPNGTPNPFSNSNATINNPNPSDQAKMNKQVLADAAEGTYNYRIFVKEKNSGVHKSDDPPLDIVPSG